MSNNYSKLQGRIIEKLGSRLKFAIALGVSERSLSLKLNNKSPWKDEEIAKSIEILELEKEDIVPYFFDYKVQQNEL